MKRLFRNIFFLIFVFTLQIFPQQFSTGSPEWLIDKFFRAENFNDKSYYYTGEMLNDTNKATVGEVLEGNGEVLFHQIKSSNNECVFSVEIKLEDKIMDMYAYLVKSGNDWKISAVRRFLLPFFIYTVYDSLSNLSTLSAKDSTLYLSLRLFIMNDFELKKFVSSHSDQLNDIIWYFNQKKNQEVDKLLAELGLSAVFLDSNYPGCTFIEITSVGRMESGFIYATDSAKLPEISSERFVFVEEVLEGWFVYRII